MPVEPESSKGKGKRHSESLITAKKWTPIATHRSIKPRNSASIQGKLTLTHFTGKITIINPVVTSNVRCTPQEPWNSKEPARGQRRIVQKQKAWKRTPWTQWWIAIHCWK
ncbi:hypothetical protein O181_021478 [Austropuccinia psidii MF-1]|uniref:Uncharacterized protein n=1 Tax=Austropuccinia psidii MF-1 TaxID=1389203 RepID=A0A9Q3GVG6_9BASI|nr:hypothetical protein [Austropuccinia psidii MF-1]